MKRLVLTLLLLAFWTQIGSAQDDLRNVPWRAQYFGNIILDGPAIVDRFEGGIGYDWGNDSPAADVPEDNFSVRWGKGGFLPAGTYRFIVTADEGFRLYVDGVVILDYWDGSARGQTVGRDIYLNAGDHKLQVDFYEREGNALIFLDWGLAPTGETPIVTPAPALIPTGDIATITTARLNVRSEPQFGNNIVGLVRAGEQYQILQRSGDNAWVRLNFGNSNGWVSTSFITTNGQPAPEAAPFLRGLTLQANSRINMRSAPSVNSDVVGVLASGEVVQIVARNSNITWWQVNQSGRIGWVSARLVTLSEDVAPTTIVIGS